MSNYRFTLEPYKGAKTRYSCPSCGKPKVFTRYVDNQTGEHVNENVGICQRLIKCTYHCPPRQYFKDNSIGINNSPKIVAYKQKRAPINERPTYISNETMQKSKRAYGKNNFFTFLSSHWNHEVARSLSDTYNIGTSNHWRGASVFWQVDADNNIRTGKIMNYDPVTGKRSKYTNWAHSVLRIKPFSLKQCFFGEHLLMTGPNKPVAIVESEKTAIIASVYMPEFIWLACGSANNLNRNITNVLKGRDVVLYPDLGCYTMWKNKMPKLCPLANYRISDMLETNATDREKRQGLDIADYLIRIGKSHGNVTER